MEMNFWKIVGIDYVLNYEFKDIKDKLYDDLNRLIKALEIYLYQYVNKINCEKITRYTKIIAKEEICKI